MTNSERGKKTLPSAAPLAAGRGWDTSELMGTPFMVNMGGSRARCSKGLGGVPVQ